MVAHPRDYRWSSWRAHATGASDPLVIDHPIYEALGRSAAERQKEYRTLFRAALDPDFVEALRAATNGGWALGKRGVHAQDRQGTAAARDTATEGAAAEGQGRPEAAKFTLTPSNLL